MLRDAETTSIAERMRRSPVVGDALSRRRGGGLVSFKKKKKKKRVHLRRSVLGKSPRAMPRVRDFLLHTMTYITMTDIFNPWALNPAYPGNQTKKPINVSIGGDYLPVEFTRNTLMIPEKMLLLSPNMSSGNVSAGTIQKVIESSVE